MTIEVNVKRLKLNFSIFYFILFKKDSFDFRHVFKNFDSNYLFLKLKLNVKYVYIIHLINSLLYQSCPNFSRVLVFSRPVLYCLFQYLCQCQSVSLSALPNILECVWWWWCFIMVHVPKASWASGVQAEGSDFKGSYSTYFHGWRS